MLEPARPEPGQWTYDVSDPEGPQMGMVAIEGSLVVYGCDEPIVIVAEHFSIGVELPVEIADPVDLVILVDQARMPFKGPDDYTHSNRRTCMLKYYPVPFYVHLLFDQPCSVSR
eukprot:scaffold132929_cov72-Attheya_sp.AAC.1